MFQRVEFDVNIQLFPVKVSKMLTEVEDLPDGCFFKDGISLESDKEFTVIGQQLEAIFFNTCNLALGLNIILGSAFSTHLRISPRALEPTAQFRLIHVV